VPSKSNENPLISALDSMSENHQHTANTIVIAVDAMGGDYAPKEIVKGTIDAISSTNNIQAILVGEKNQIESELSKYEIHNLPLTIIPSEGVILEEESPTQALRTKPNSSIAICADLVKKGMANGLVTMGSTGAAMAVSSLIFGMIKGIKRPAIGGPILGMAPNSVLMDLGSNVDCRPSQLVNFGIIGSFFASQILSIENPKVGLLSVGSEEGKGNRQVKEASEALRKTGLNFIGNIEGTDLPSGKADVVICDGFVGNIVMKLSESLGDYISKYVMEKLNGRLSPTEITNLGKEIFNMTNLVENVGGGPIFGVNGISIVGHGRAKASAVTKAIEMAKRIVTSDFVNRLEKQVSYSNQVINTKTTNGQEIN